MTRPVRALIHLILIASLAACAHRQAPPKTMPKTTLSPQLDTTTFTSFDYDKFGYKHWKSASEPKIVIIGVHGINGAASDYDNFGDYIQQHNSDIALYAFETRGQGNDLKKHRRGDIYKAEEWYQDLRTFTALVRKEHPIAKIIWCGESMGSLIVTHAFHHSKTHQNSKNPICDGIILLAPVVDLTHQLARWKFTAAKMIAAIFPRYKVALNLFSGDDTVKVTQGANDHDTQAATNSYYIDKFTLRLLATLGKNIDGMNLKAESIDLPILVVNGGKDYFTPKQYTEQFFSKIPSSTDKTHRYYPDAYHLLMYDEQRNAIFAEMLEWLDKWK